MFNRSKYTRWYRALIAKAKTQVVQRKTTKGCYHRHHIIPESLGGSDLPQNKVILTPREHFIAHLLLMRMTSGKDRSKMAYALQRFGGKNQTSRSFELASKLISKALSGEGNGMFGKHLSPEHSIKISGKNHGMYGRYCYDLWVENYGEEVAKQLDKSMKDKR